ncbi:NUDIX domain-containing protein [Erythrobacteraceae bacterium WH01K]|nr:NUDIX domain-containing protein [Erythrobacteraceae bacterium WH01K]
MEKNLTPMLVVACALERGDGRFLLHRRPHGKENAGFWEFPGGKVEPGEGAAQALSRELMEECGLAVPPSTFEPVGFALEPRSGRELLLMLFYSGAVVGDPRSLEGGVWQWHSLDRARYLDLAPLDRQLCENLSGWLARKKA